LPATFRDEFEKALKKLLANKTALIGEAIRETNKLENTEAQEAERKRIIDKIKQLTSKSTDEATMAKVKRLENKLG